MSKHPGEFLRFLIIEEEISAYAAAERTGLTIEQIGDIIAGKIPVSTELAEKLAKLGGTPTMWTDMQRAFDLA